MTHPAWFKITPHLKKMKCCGAGTVISCVSWNCEFHDFLGDRSFIFYGMKNIVCHLWDYGICHSDTHRCSSGSDFTRTFSSNKRMLATFWVQKGSGSAITTYGDPHHCSVLVYQFTDISNKWHDIKLWNFNSKKLKNVRLKTCGKYLDGSSWWPRLQQPGP